MLTSVTFAEDSTFARRVGGARTFTFEPQGVTVLCGPNGSGKSTLLSSLRQGPVTPGRGVVFANVEITKDVGVLYVDFEHDTGRSEMQRFSNLAARSKSRGQSSKELLKALKEGFKVIPDTKPMLFVLDEPDQACDLDGIEELWGWILLLNSRPLTQVLVATHNPFLILESSFHVLEMVPGYLDRIRLHAQTCAA